jgi:hypothetical protein
MPYASGFLKRERFVSKPLESGRTIEGVPPPDAILQKNATVPHVPDDRLKTSN